MQQSEFGKAEEKPSKLDQEVIVGDQSAVDLSNSRITHSVSAGRQAIDYEPVVRQLKHFYDTLGPWIVQQSGNPDNVERKADNSVVTNVDKEVERQLHILMDKAFPQALFVGEESWEKLNRDPSMAKSFERVTVVDPIDGTSNFVKGVLSDFASSLGIWKSTATGYEPEFGAIFCPDENCIYYTLESEVRRFDIASGSDVPFIPQALALQDIVEFTSAKGDNAIPTQASANHSISHAAGAASVPDIVSMLRGNGHACVTRGKFWDVAGALALGKALGYRIYDADSMTEVHSLDFSKVNPNADSPWLLPDVLLLCKPEHFAAVKDCLK